MKSVKVIVFLMVAMLFFGGCQSNNKEQSSQEEIKIGALLSLHGANATQGNLAKNGLLLAVDKVNGAGGIQGKKIKLIIEDTFTEEAKTISALKKLATVDKVQGIVVTGDIELPIVNKYADNYKIPIMATICTGMLDEYRSDWVFRYCYNEEQEDAFLMKYVSEELGIKDMALLCPDNVAGKAFYTYSKKYIDMYKINVVADISYDPNSTNQRENAFKVINSNPQIICARGFGSSLDALLKYIGELGYKGPVVGDLSLSASTLTQDPNSVLNGAYIVASDMNMESDNPVMAAYAKTYTDMFKENPCFWDVIGYDSFMYLYYALKESQEKSVDFKTALFSIRPKDLLLGENWFEDSNDVSFKKMYIFEMKNGKLSNVRTLSSF